MTERVQVTVWVDAERLTLPRYIGDPKRGGRVAVAGEIAVRWPGGAWSVVSAEEWRVMREGR